MKKIICLLLISISIIVFVYNDYFLYREPILKINVIETKAIGDDTLEEKTFIQNIKGVIKNGTYKGKVLSTINTYSKSLVYDDKLEKNSEIFVELSSDGEDIVNISGIKRDKYIAILLVIFVDLITIIGGNKGIKILFSLFINIAITALGIVLFIYNVDKINLLTIFAVASVLYVITSLFIANGKSKKTLAAISSSIVSLIISFLISYIILKVLENKLYIWNMEYIEAVFDYSNYLYVTVLLCGLGAIMDISITVTSSLNELIVKNPNINKLSLIKSSKEITKDIIGTMINVMLFTCYTSVIPTILLAIKNNISLKNALVFYGNTELIIVLCTAIGIVLSIPISLLISVNILNKRELEVTK